MPSPGTTTLKTGLASQSFILESVGGTLNFNPEGEFIQKLANAIHTGWTSISPSTPTTMVTSFTSEFASYMMAGSLGKLFMIDSVAQGIDNEVQQWVSSWDSFLQIHSYSPNGTSIKNRILSLYTGPHSNGVIALCTTIGNTFAQYFVTDPGIGNPA